ncbi:HEPN domain-containing protein [Pseudidiomarina terrestris]|uniref:HEPN domain-containing protein n=1 Tax=Pseudidiomarina terrestris TaxID=2820060 RepID=UPI00264BDF3E|nr:MULTISPECIES: HEPN domain-containing protein [unclassified Pseudidiomarina]MDN7136343.1 hypothetical protein [Pseudidiomarina sp. 1ASP75-5]MEA3588797.1 hypothetical protein [Pseudidiomarina sp. 1APP75-27a]
MDEWKVPNQLTHTMLKAFQRKQRETWSKGLSLRVHRALSWLDRAEQERHSKDLDAEFLFLWIGFNAAYASEYSQDSRLNQRDAYAAFFERILTYDQSQQLYAMIWEHYPNKIRTLMNNPYVFQPFWDSATGRNEPDAWKASFDSAKRAGHKALAERDVVTSLSIIMDRLYTLRNQLVHGGATWNGQLNRDQLRDGCGILAHLLPMIIQLMMFNGNDLWGDAAYFMDQQS